MKAPFESLTASDPDRSWNRAVHWAAYVLAAELICVLLLAVAVTRVRPIYLKTQITHDAEVPRMSVDASGGACRYRAAKLQLL